MSAAADRIPPMAEGYRYDAFVSYSRSGVAREWVENHFWPLLEQALSLHRPTQLFVGRDPETGQAWPEHTADALARSRCLISILSPSYFRSPWCVSELESFLERERRFMTQPGSLILPVAMSGTAHFPREMQERQAASFQQWAVPFQHFRQSSSYHDFLTAVNRFCEPLIARIESAPPWSPDFPIVRRETVAAPDAPVLFPRL